MNKNTYIYIVGPEDQKIKEAVQSLANLYADTESTNSINIYKSDINEYIINFPTEPDFERFKYFVNYLHYPEGDPYKARVFGYWTISESDKIKQHLNKRTLLYVSENDTEGDNVHAIFQGEDKPAKLGFAVGEEYQELEKNEFEFGEPEIDESKYHLIETINPVVTPKKKSGSGCMVTATLILVIIVLITTPYI